MPHGAACAGAAADAAAAQPAHGLAAHARMLGWRLSLGGCPICLPQAAGSRPEAVGLSRAASKPSKGAATQPTKALSRVVSLVPRNATTPPLVSSILGSIESTLHQWHLGLRLAVFLFPACGMPGCLQRVEAETHVSSLQAKLLHSHPSHLFPMPSEMLCARTRSALP